MKLCKICAMECRDASDLKRHLTEYHGIGAAKAASTAKGEKDKGAKSSGGDKKTSEKNPGHTAAEISEAEEAVKPLRKGMFYFFADGKKCKTKKEAVDYYLSM